MEEIKYLDLVQTDPKEFNKKQNQIRMEYKKNYGFEKLQELMESNLHNDIKKTRTVNYELNSSELNLLLKNKLLIKSSTKSMHADSFGKHLINLYQNDMPVFITSDMMLYALHRFYDETIEKIETKFIDDLKQLCESLLDTIKTINLNVLSLDQIDQIKGVELYILVPYFLLHYQTDTPDNIYNRVKNPFAKESTKKQIFKIPKNQPYLNNPSDVRKITESIRKYSFENCVINKVKFNVDGSNFKPRGHYTNSIELESYFMAFQWLSKCIVKLDPSKSDEYINGFMFSALLSKIAEKSIEQVNKIETFVKKLIGEPDGYTLTNFLEVVNLNYKYNQIDISPEHHQPRGHYNMLKIHPSEHQPRGYCDMSHSWKFTEIMNQQKSQQTDNSSTLNTVFDAKLFFEQIENIISKSVLTKKCKLTKFGDGGMMINENFLTPYCFSLIGKGTTFDNSLINDVVDVNYSKNVPSSSSRKFPSIFDVTYAIFNNESTIDFVNEKSQNYIDYLNLLKTKYNNQFTNLVDQTNQTNHSIYEQSLIMLRSLSKYPNISPFNTKSWAYKQSQTQIGHYNEIRHDNVLYLDECDGFMLCCKYEDIMVEPCIEFWHEYLKMITMIESIVIKPDNMNNSIIIEILQNFKNTTNKILQYLEYFIENKEVPQNLKDELMCILKSESHGSGEMTYCGWYSKLFYNSKDSVMNKNEVSSYFSAVNDERGEGGICHLGNGNVQLMYIIVNNSVYIGPVYQVYDFITPTGVRLNDTEWSTKKTNFKSINFNIK